MSNTTTVTADVTGDEPKKLDDVMLAMDVVDTLRHRASLVGHELDSEKREEELIARLREIYSAQGIDVPDGILRDGVNAMEEKRFHYEPPKPSLSVKLAKFYIGRDRWLKPVAVLLGISAFVTALYEFGFERPQRTALRETQIELTEKLPAALSTARDGALSVVSVPRARQIIETTYQDGVIAAEAGQARDVEAAIKDLNTYRTIGAKELRIKIVSEPGERTAVFRFHDNDQSLRNYYLIVEAVDLRGRAQALEITSEENNARAFADKWGVRVSKETYDRVAADKNDDQIIQDNIIGEKPRGALAPIYTIENAGGAILEW